MGHVFVLGAGVSRTAGLPLAGELLGEVCENALAPDAREELDAFLEYVIPTFSREHANYPDVEEFLSLLEVAEQWTKIQPTGVRFPRRRLSRLKRTFLLAMAGFLWRGHEAVGKDHPIALLAQHLEDGDVVITFNYDLTMERAADHWEYGPRLNKETVVLLKPHGSIDWFHADDADSTAPDMNELFVDFTQFAGWQFDEQALAGKMPVIVPPVPGKTIELQDLADIWRSAARALMQAEGISIIGYSLPDADKLTRFVLRRAIRNNLDKGRGQVTVVNPDGSLRAKYRECIADEVVFVQQKFETWAKRLSSARPTPVRQASSS